MDDKIKYIQSLTGSLKDFSFEFEAESNDEYFNKLKSLAGSKFSFEAHTLKSKPTPRRGQLWLIKPTYEDYFINRVESDMPFIVLIVEANDTLENELFSRVQPVSIFTEFVAGDDYVVNDPSLIGFPFLVETWNEQPVLNEILDYSLGSFDIDQHISFKGNVDLTEQKAAFRKLEVDNTAFLRHSVLSYLKFLEERQTEDTGIIISINQHIVKPAFFVDEIKYDTHYAYAAKTGIDNSNKYFEWEEKLALGNIKIRIKRNIEDFILSVYSDIEFVLRSSDNKVLAGSKAEGRMIFTMLNPGLYYLESASTKSLIKIRIK